MTFGGGGGGGDHGGGDGGGGDVGGGRRISWNDPLLTESSISVFIEKALPTDLRTYGRTYGWTDPLVEVRGRI